VASSALRIHDRFIVVHFQAFAVAGGAINGLALMNPGKACLVHHNGFLCGRNLHGRRRWRTRASRCKESKHACGKNDGKDWPSDYSALHDLTSSAHRFVSVDQDRMQSCIFGRL
jgi:hypothetical protein